MRSFIFLAVLFRLATPLPQAALSVLSEDTGNLTDMSTARTSPSANAIIVDNSAAPISGSFPTVGEAIAALSASATNKSTYHPSPLLTIQGYTTDAYNHAVNEVTISYNLSRNNVSNNDLTATVRNWSSKTTFYNLIIENTFGHTTTNGQNLALNANGSNQGFYGMQLLGYQDTILAQQVKQMYAGYLITGVVYFIFGQYSSAWFEKVDIRTFGTGYITASGRLTQDSDSWFVINNSTVAVLNDVIPVGSTYLERPWKEWARVTFQNMELSNVVNEEGWHIWSEETPNTANSTLSEFGNSGDGSVGPRASFAQFAYRQLEVADILGADWEGWVDTTFM